MEKQKKRDRELVPGPSFLVGVGHVPSPSQGLHRLAAGEIPGAIKVGGLWKIAPYLYWKGVEKQAQDAPSRERDDVSGER